MNSLLLALGVAILLVSFIPSSEAVKSCYIGVQDLTSSSSTAPTQATCGDAFVFCQVNNLLRFNLMTKNYNFFD